MNISHIDFFFFLSCPLPFFSFSLALFLSKNNKKIFLKRIYHTDFIKQFNSFSLFLEWIQHASISKNCMFGPPAKSPYSSTLCFPNCSYSGFLSAPHIHHAFYQHLSLQTDVSSNWLYFPLFLRLLIPLFVWDHHFGGNFPQIF